MLKNRIKLKKRIKLKNRIKRAVCQASCIDNAEAQEKNRINRETEFS